MQNKNLIQAIFNKIDEIDESANSLPVTFRFLVKSNVGKLATSIMKDTNNISQTKFNISEKIGFLKEICDKIPSDDKQSFQNKLLIIEGLIILLE